MVINYEDIFDSLKEYIDKKIDTLDEQIRELFEEYDIKLVVEHLGEIQTIADNILHLQIVSDNIAEVINVSENMSYVIRAVESAEDAAKYASEAFKWGNAPEDVHLEDTAGNAGYSAYHWAQKAINYGRGMMKYIGLWDPSKGDYPAPPQGGYEPFQFWTSISRATFNNREYFISDWICRNSSNTGWFVIPAYSAFESMTDYDQISQTFIMYKDMFDVSPGPTGKGRGILLDAYGKIDESFLHDVNTAVWGNISGTLSNQTDLYQELSRLDNKFTGYFQKNEFVDNAGDAAPGRPVKLNSEGLVDYSLLSFDFLTFVGKHEISSTNEYPSYDLTNHNGDFWIVSGLGLEADGSYTTYTLTGGPNAGETVRDGYLFILRLNDDNTFNSWVIHETELDVYRFLKTDGSNAMTADLNVGLHKVINLKAGVNDNDAVTVSQLNAMNGKLLVGEDV